jgi:GTPase SAR1 family protein
MVQGVPSYYVNLDPAVKDVPFAANIDIRDTVAYKEVMRQYSLGPNGAITTSLNLFATRFDQVRGPWPLRPMRMRDSFPHRKDGSCLVWFVDSP